MSSSSSRSHSSNGSCVPLRSLLRCWVVFLTCSILDIWFSARFLSDICRDILLEVFLFPSSLQDLGLPDVSGISLLACRPWTGIMVDTRPGCMRLSHTAAGRPGASLWWASVLKDAVISRLTRPALLFSEAAIKPTSASGSESSNISPKICI